MANSIKIKVNGLTHGVSASLDTPLLYVLHNELHLHGPRFGCGLAQCGACSVLLDGKEIRSCVTPVAAVTREEHHDAGGPAGPVCGAARHDGGGAGAASVAAGVDRRAGAALRLLPERDDDPGRRPARDDEEPVRGSDPHGDERASVPLRDVSENPDRDPEGRGRDGEGRCVMTGLLHEKEFSRKSFLKGGGALIVGFSLAGSALAGKASAIDGDIPTGYNPDINQVDSWLTIDADNTVVAQDEPDRDRQRDHDRLPAGARRRARHGHVADALRPVQPEQPHGRRHVRSPVELRRRGRLERDVGHRPEDPQRRRARAPGAARHGLDAARRPGREPDGRQGRRLGRRQDASPTASCRRQAASRSRGANVSLQPGVAPAKPISAYKTVLKDPNPVVRIDIPDKVTGKYTYVHQVRVPGMLHGRMVRPRGQGAYPYNSNVPVSVDATSIAHIPGAQVVHVNNFLGVVAPKEFDAIQAAAQLKVVWNTNPILPGTGNLWKHYRDLDAAGQDPGDAQQRDRRATSTRRSPRRRTRCRGRFKHHYQGHMPIGPSCAVADVTGEPGDDLEQHPERLQPRHRPGERALAAPGAARSASSSTRARARSATAASRSTRPSRRRSCRRRSASRCACR